MKILILTFVVLTSFTRITEENHFHQSSSKEINVKTLQNLSPPEFPGGEKEFNNYLTKNMKWPDPKSGIQGTVVISFYVEKDGTLLDFKIEKKVEKSFDEEALRVMQHSPKWLPATKNGIPVKSKYSVPIKFFLNEG